MIGEQNKKQAFFKRCKLNLQKKATKKKPVALGNQLLLCCYIELSSYGWKVRSVMASKVKPETTAITNNAPAAKINN